MKLLRYLAARRFTSMMLALACSVAIGSALPARGADKVLLNLDRNGVALAGHDPVAFFTVKAPVKGKPEFASDHGGARYLFHSAKSKAAFDAAPEKYVPAFGGYCAFGVSRGKLVEIDVEAFQIVGARLLMQYDKKVRDDFGRDPDANLRKADANWPRLVAAKGR